MHVIFDTETTGLANFKLPPGDDSQPHLVQLGVLLLDDDWAVRGEFHTIVKPVVGIPEAASRVHGVTNDLAQRVGLDLKLALEVFFSYAARATALVAHNLKFDSLIINAATKRAGLTPGKLQATRFCTMDAMTPLCKIPGPYGFKWPKLQEAHRYCFGHEFDGAHDAMEDVRACGRVYRYLIERPRGVATETALELASV